MPLLHPHLLCILSEKWLVEQLNFHLASLLPAVLSVKGICYCPSADKVWPYPLILICPEKLTSKATAALQRGNKLQWSGESVASPSLARAPGSLWRGPGPACRDKQPKFEGRGGQEGWLFVNLSKEGKPFRLLSKNPFITCNQFSVD